METRKSIGLLLPTRGIVMKNPDTPNVDLLFELAEEAERIGLDSLWVGDSLLSKPRLEPITTLSAIAARTSTVRIGTAVLLAAMRNPVLLAHSVATLDIISRGRAILGMGVGGVFNDALKKEWGAVGVLGQERAKRFEEIAEILRLLWTKNDVSYCGEYFHLDNVNLQPKPFQQGGVPIWIACHERAGKPQQWKRAAALGDGIVSISDTPDELEVGLQKYSSYLQMDIDDSLQKDVSFYLTININQDQHVAEKDAHDYLSRYYGSNIWGTRWGPFGSADSIIERCNQYWDAGVNHLIVRFASFDPIEQLKRFETQVLPYISDPV